MFTLPPGLPSSSSGGYFVRVMAVNATSASPPSNETSFNPGFGCGTRIAPQGAPTALSATVSQSTVTLRFGAVSSSSPDNAVAAYTVLAGTASGTADVGTIDGGTSSPIVLPNVPRGTYFMRVRARNSCGFGLASNEVTVAVP